MTLTNMPILYQNVCFGLPCETSRKAFLWCADRDRSRFKYAAENFAHEVAVLMAFLNRYLPIAGRPNGITDECLDDLKKFFLKRHANYRFGGNVKMWWEGQS